MSRAHQSYRQEQAAATRTRIAGSARRVFAARGYSAATIADIADDAGVAPSTVYKIYLNKRGLLAAVVDAWRNEFVPRKTDAIPQDPRHALAWWAATIMRQWDSGLDIAGILTGAAASEPEVLQELSARLAVRDTWIRHVTRTIAPNLAVGLTQAKAAAILSAQAMPDVYRELVTIRGWQPDEYRTWLEDTLKSQLLANRPRCGKAGTRGDSSTDGTAPQAYFSPEPERSRPD